MSAKHIEGGEQQETFGESIALHLLPGTVVYLEGDLGAGKTTLVRGILRGLGYTGTVRSPTYTLMESYDTNNCVVHHFDLYRLGDPEELEYLGIRDVCDDQSILLIEWPDKGRGFLPAVDLQINISHLPSSREISFEAKGGKGEAFVAAMSESSDTIN